MTSSWRNKLSPKAKIRLGITLGVVLAWGSLAASALFVQWLQWMQADRFGTWVYWFYVLVFVVDLLCCPLVIGFAGTFFWQDMAADFGQLYKWAETAFNIWIAALIILTCGLLLPLGPLLLFLAWTGVDLGMRCWGRQFWLEWLDREAPSVRQRARRGRREKG
jgi:hypothetical protein